MYLLLSAITALLECGPIFLLYFMSLKPWQVLTSCLAYQTGNLLPLRFHFRKGQLIRITCLAFILFIAAYFFPNSPILQWLLLLPGLICLSTSLQITRSMVKNKCSTALKRISRVMGFISAPLIGYLPQLLLPAICVIVLLCLKHTDKDSDTNCTRISLWNLRKNNYYTIMLWHQLHYFTYAYAIILVILQKTQRPFLTMLLFGTTWITYLLTEPLLRRIFKNRSRTIKGSIIPIILVGHLFLIFILLLLPAVDSLFCFSFLWILAGFGGGTVFAITLLCQHLGACQKSELEYMEGIGHFLGTFIEIIWLLFFPDALTLLPYLSAICAAFVLRKTLIYKKENL